MVFREVEQMKPIKGFALVNKNGRINEYIDEGGRPILDILTSKKDAIEVGLKGDWKIVPVIITPTHSNAGREGECSAR